MAPTPKTSAPTSSAPVSAVVASLGSRIGMASAKSRWSSISYSSVQPTPITG